MSKKFIWLSTILLALLLCQPSFAHSHHRFDRLAQELNLTAEQKAEIKAYKEKAKASLKENYAQLRLLRDQINSLIKTDKIDEAKLDALIEKVNKIRGAMLKSKILMQNKMFTLLNEKQKAKFLQLKEKWFLKHD